MPYAMHLDCEAWRLQLMAHWEPPKKIWIGKAVRFLRRSIFTTCWDVECLFWTETAWDSCEPSAAPSESDGMALTLARTISWLWQPQTLQTKRPTMLIGPYIDRSGSLFEQKVARNMEATWTHTYTIEASGLICCSFTPVHLMNSARSL